MYDTALQNPDKNFKVAYRSSPSERTLNGYTGEEMMDMFYEAGPIPSNVMFSEEWSKVPYLANRKFNQDRSSGKVNTEVNPFDSPTSQHRFNLVVWYGTQNNNLQLILL
jgi:hypothetical protein